MFSGVAFIDAFEQPRLGRARTHECVVQGVLVQHMRPSWLPLHGLVPFDARSASKDPAPGLRIPDPMHDDGKLQRLRVRVPIVRPVVVPRGQGESSLRVPVPIVHQDVLLGRVRAGAVPRRDGGRVDRGAVPRAGPEHEHAAVAADVREVLVPGEIAEEGRGVPQREAVRVHEQPKLDVGGPQVELGVGPDANVLLPGGHVVDHVAHPPDLVDVVLVPLQDLQRAGGHDLVDQNHEGHRPELRQLAGQDSGADGVFIGRNQRHEGTLQHRMATVA